MKILAVGDFHGSIPRFLKKVVQKENPDLIVSIGDYFPFHARTLFFKYAYKTQIPLWKFIGKKRDNELTNKDLVIGKKVISYLDSFNREIIFVTGNHDFSGQLEAADYKIKSWKDKEDNYLDRILKKHKNFRITDYQVQRFKDLVFIGYPASTFPGRIKSKRFKIQKKKLEELFRKFKNKRIVFLSHNVPYGLTKLDLIRDKKAHKLAKGRHYGAKITRYIIEKYKPFLCICGHMHENPGKVKFRKTLVLNAGPAYEKRYAIININSKKLDVKLKRCR